MQIFCLLRLMVYTKFKEALRMYAELVKEVAKMEAELRPLKKAVGTIKQNILVYMQAQDIDECKSSCNSWAITRRETCRAEPLKPAHILEELVLVMSHAKAQALVDKINERRKVSKKERLVHTVKK